MKREGDSCCLHLEVGFTNPSNLICSKTWEKNVLGSEEKVSDWTKSGPCVCEKLLNLEKRGTLDESNEDN